MPVGQSYDQRLMSAWRLIQQPFVHSSVWRLPKYVLSTVSAMGRACHVRNSISYASVTYAQRTHLVSYVPFTVV
jgi:hypothetical protein